MSKRKRDPSFAASEKMALIELVEKYYHTVESKKTDAVTMKNKTEGWRLLSDDFNAISSIYPRDWSVLKNCWENLKKRAKQEQTLRNQHFLGTGGGPPKKVSEDPAIERVLELIRTRVTGFINCFDSDGTRVLGSGSIYSSLEQEPTPTENLFCISDMNADDSQVTLPEQEVVVNESGTTLTIDWSQYNPSMLRSNRNQALLQVRSPSPPPDVQISVEESTQEGHQALSTPPRAARIMTATGSTSRRRPTVRHERERENLNTERIRTLIKSTTYAEEEHRMQMNILQLQQQKEKEILEQEKIKTKQEIVKLQILELQLKNLKD